MLHLRLKMGKSVRASGVVAYLLLTLGFQCLVSSSLAQENIFNPFYIADESEPGFKKTKDGDFSTPIRLQKLETTSRSLPLPPALQDVLSAALDYGRINNKTYLLDVVRGGGAAGAIGRAHTAAPLPGGGLGTEANNKDVKAAAPYLTLDEALVRARRHSPDIKTARATHEASGYSALATIGAYGPKIDYKNGRGREISYNGLAVPASNYPDHERVDKTFVLRQPILDLNILAGYKRDLSAEQAAGFNREISEDAVTQDVLSAYFDLTQALIGIWIADDYQKRLESMMRYISSRAQSGVVSDVELQRVQAASLGAERVKFDAVSARDIALAMLERMIGDVPFHIAFPVRSLMNMPKNPEQALPLLMNRSAELKANQKQVEAAFYDQAAAFARFAPKLDLEVGQYDAKNPSGVAGKTQDRRAILTFSVSLLNGGTDYAYARAQTAKREQVEFQYQSVYEKTVQRLRVYYLTLQGVDRQIETSKKEYLTYKAVAEDYDRQLDVAPKSITDLLDVNNKYYQAKTNLINLNIKRLQLAYTINYYLKEF